MSKKLNIITIPLLILVELVFWILIVFVRPSNISLFCFFSVITACLVSFVFSLSNPKKLTISFALLFTVIADLFLVVLRLTKTTQSLGLIFFNIVQILYFLYIFIDNKHKKASLIFRISLNVLMIIISIIVLKSNVDLVSILTMIYISNLFANIVDCFLTIKTNYMLLIGLIFLIMCDIFLGLVMADGIYLFYKDGSFLYKLVRIPLDFSWFCYIPSQTIIAVFANKK